jgi:hypothetical protein
MTALLGVTLQVKAVLRELDPGSSVAEYDTALQRYFVETQTFRDLLSGNYDVVAGDKGTGKTALYRILKEQSQEFAELAGIDIVPAFNPAGTPIFQRLAESETLSESAYISFWKAYLLALVGNWILGISDGYFDSDASRLHDLLTRTGLRSLDATPHTVFAQLINRVKRLLGRTSAVETKASVDPNGIPIIGARLEFSDDETFEKLSRHDEALRLLNRILESWDTTAWIVLDRLDEAFQSQPTLETPALRALLRTYLDFNEFSRMRIKLFVRKDLFGRITAGGFVNLTHINAKKIEITWDEEDLRSLLQKRLTGNSKFVSSIAVDPNDGDAIFDAIFPRQVEPGPRKPTTWTWMMGRIRDGNDVKPPRNLIDLVVKSKDTQLRREERAPRQYVSGSPLIEADALKRGLGSLSNQRVEDTLLAEAGDAANDIELFRRGKAEHNAESLGKVLGERWEEKVGLLQQLGFLEAIGSNYKIPMIYRSGLEITQGKAFAPHSESMGDNEDDD